MNRNARLLITVGALVLMNVIFSNILPAQEKIVDRADATEVANYVLGKIKTTDYEAILQIMDPDRKKDFTPLTDKKKQELIHLFQKDNEKIGKIDKVSELRQVKTYSGKEGIAAKIRKKDGEVFVIVLSKGPDYLYYYEYTLNLTTKLYKELHLIKKLK